MSNNRIWEIELKNNVYNIYDKSLRNNFVSVKDFGAIGDGISDDTPAFINMYKNTNVNVFIIPKGIYKVSQRIAFPENSVTFAYGAKIIIDSENDTFSILEIKYNNIKLYGLEVDCSKVYDNSRAVYSTCLLIHQTNTNIYIKNILVKDCYFHNSDKYGINITENCEKVTIENCILDNVQIGIRIRNLSNSIIKNCKISNTFYENIEIQNGNNIRIENCYFNNCLKDNNCYLISLNKTIDCSIDNNNFSFDNNNSYNGINIITLNNDTIENDKIRISGSSFTNVNKGIEFKSNSGNYYSVKSMNIFNNNFINCNNGIIIDNIKETSFINNNIFDNTNNILDLSNDNDKKLNIISKLYSDIPIIFNDNSIEMIQIQNMVFYE